MAELLNVAIDEQHAEAMVRGEQRLHGPRAATAHYDVHRHRVVIMLVSGLEVSLSPHDAEGLEAATPDELSQIEITPFGLGLHFPKIDADLYVPTLLEGLLGSSKWMAARMGATGGQAKTARKSSASRENGKLGGRPKKVA